MSIIKTGMKMKVKLLSVLMIVFFVTFSGCGGYAIHSAIQKGDSQKALALIEKAKDINSVNKNGETALLAAAREGDDKVAGYLLQLGADPELKNLQGYAPIHMACYKGHLNIVNLLIQNNVKLNEECNFKYTPVFYAAQEGYIEIVKALLDAGVQINHQSSEGETALHIAAFKGHLDIVEYLVNNGADIDLLNNNNRRPLHAALFRDNETVALYLIDCGSEINISGTTTDDIYATANAYKLYANHLVAAGEVEEARDYYQVASSYFEKASLNFKEKSEDYKTKSTRAKVRNVLGRIGAAASAYGSATSSITGFGVGVYSVEKTASLDDLAKLYEVMAGDNHLLALKYHQAGRCYDDMANAPDSLKQCIEKTLDLDMSAFAVLDDEAKPDEQEVLKLLQLHKSRPYISYTEWIFAQSDNKEATRILIPTYEAYLKGMYEDTGDPNTGLAKKFSAEMFINAFSLNSPRFIEYFGLVSTKYQFENDEYFVCYTKNSFMTNKRLFVIDDQKVNEVVTLTDIVDYRIDPGWGGASVIIDLTNGESLKIKKSLPLPPYIDAFKGVE